MTAHFAQTPKLGRFSHTGGVSPVKFEEDYYSRLESVYQTLGSPVQLLSKNKSNLRFKLAHEI